MRTAIFDAISLQGALVSLCLSQRDWNESQLGLRYRNNKLLFSHAVWKYFTDEHRSHLVVWCPQTLEVFVFDLRHVRDVDTRNLSTGISRYVVPPGQEQPNLLLRMPAVCKGIQILADPNFNERLFEPWDVRITVGSNVNCTFRAKHMLHPDNYSYSLLRGANDFSAFLLRKDNVKLEKES